MKKWNLYYYPSISEWENKSVTISDYSRIMNRIQDDLGKKHIAPHVLHHLYLSLSKARKYFSEEIPQDIVTMNSEIMLTMDDGKTSKMKLVYPEEAKNSEDISVYSSMGAACLGCKEKSMISYYDGTRNNKAVIEKIVFQPETEKLFYL